MAYQEEEQVRELYFTFINKLISLIEEKAPFLEGHCSRVARYASLIARSIKVPEDQLQEIHIAGLLHDIGYITINHPIIRKPGKLNDEEKSIIRTHTISAQSLLAHINLNQNILRNIRSHHEAYDGTGYPDGLSADRIPLGARALFIAEAFDGMTSRRPYREALPVKEALGELLHQAGGQFDPKMAKIFALLMERYFENRKSRTLSSGDDLRNKRQMLDKIRQEVMGGIKNKKIKLPVLPEVLSHVQSVLTDPDATIREAALVIRKDASISTALIALANSPYYKGVKEVSSLEEAISRLGLKETLKLCTMIGNRGLYHCDEKKYKSLMASYWNHNLACAHIASFIAKKTGLEDPDTFFTMGLIHDIGKGLVLSALVPILKRNNHENAPAESDVRQLISEMHTKIGSLVLKRWKFDAKYVDAAGNHAKRVERNNAPDWLKALQLSNLLTVRTECRPDHKPDEDRMAEELMSILGITQHDVELMIQRTLGILNSAKIAEN